MRHKKTEDCGTVPCYLEQQEEHDCIKVMIGAGQGDPVRRRNFPLAGARYCQCFVAFRSQWHHLTPSWVPVHASALA